MFELIDSFLGTLATPWLFAVIAVALFLLSQGTDLLIDQAVKLSAYWGVPKIIIGATIVSLGTTLPEASVSVLAAWQNQPGLALGNGIGSIIANTGLILGLSALLGTVPVDRRLVSRQGLMMILASLVVAVSSLPYFSGADGGHVSRPVGIVFVVLLLIYLYLSVYWAKRGAANPSLDLENQTPIEKPRWLETALKFMLGLFLILVSSRLLIDSVEITAMRLGIPQAVIAATLVAFGTSVPELAMAIKSVRRGHGELALGNVVGANVLNVLFVIGISAAVTAAGLPVPVEYYWVQFPALFLLLSLFWLSTWRRKTISKPFGGLLLATYLAYLLISYLV